MDFAGVKLRLGSVAADIDRESQRFEGAKATMSASLNVLSNIATTYAEVITACDDNAAVNAAWAAAKAEKDQLAADGAALKAKIQAAVDALPS
jgi:hypothetical protein